MPIAMDDYQDYDDIRQYEDEMYKDDLSDNASANESHDSEIEDKFLSHIYYGQLTPVPQPSDEKVNEPSKDGSPSRKRKRTGSEGSQNSPDEFEEKSDRQDMTTPMTTQSILLSDLQGKSLPHPNTEEYVAENDGDAFVEYDGGVRRYWEEEKSGNKSCLNCGQKDHMRRDCTRLYCYRCGTMDHHDNRNCPYADKCHNCGVSGHKAARCNKPMNRETSCALCKRSTHRSDVCPTIWRNYHVKDLNEERNTHVQPYCYNCAAMGHYGDECPRPRGHPLRFVEPSAFSSRNLPPFIKFMNVCDENMNNKRDDRRQGRPQDSYRSSFNRIHYRDGNGFKQRESPENDVDDWFQKRGATTPPWRKKQSKETSRYQSQYQSTRPHSSSISVGGAGKASLPPTRQPSYQGGYSRTG